MREEFCLIENSSMDTVSFAARTRSKAWISLHRKNIRFDANVIGMVRLGIIIE